ncbi:uncharacterized protein FIBRA_08339 [Fibroporia radiculosa]|uniref:PhoD-like phosphatase metallophosphatase domain-containing protein n=1 Tax=Fibroporia radiculosa TaxID=599839 RepID=J4I2K5_9APHY|nr:uncharacterized protein FIBRA_08339 [Fibroporia radiculosa]CCM06092.1 predicted protein [Fibroporia radiculosa]
MAKLARTQALVSTLFRIVTYLFLRVAPHHLFRNSIATLYPVYLVLFYLQPYPATSRVAETPKKETVSDLKPETEASTDTVAPIKVLPVSEVPQSSSSPLFALIFSLPTSSRSLRIVNLIINTLLFTAATDLLLYPYFDDARDVVFSRVGAVYSDAAKIVVRYPGVDSTSRMVQISWRQVTSPEFTSDEFWKEGPAANLTAENDWVATVKLTGLWPSTEYEYQLEDTNGTVLPYPTAPIRFHTFPDSLLHSGSHFRFVASSCLIPNYPYVPFHGRRIRGFDLLADYLWPAVQETDLAETISSATTGTTDPVESGSTEIPSSSVLESPSPTHNHPVVATEPGLSTKPKPPTEFMLMLGDFIYADVPWYFGDDKEAYRRLYRRNYQSDSFRRVYEHLPIFHLYDDHEIINNFAGYGNDSAPPFPSANDAYTLYNAQSNHDSAGESQNYYEFQYGDAAFFVMDTRRYRSVIEVTDEASRTMLGDKQLGALYDWLGRVNNTATFKFLVSSVPFTSLWTHEGQIDTWAAFVYEKSALLSALHSVPNVIVISGDRHEFGAIEFTGEDPSFSVLEVSTSPLSMFYVPLIRTLNMRSEGTVLKKREVVQTAENGTKEVVTVMEEVPQEKVIKYLPLGYHKWSSFEVDTRNPEHPFLRLEVMIEGSPAYHMEIRGHPVRLQTSTSIGTYMPQTLKGVLDKIGLRPSLWF